MRGAQDADGTQQQDTYTNGLLSDSLQLDNGEGAVADTSYFYNPNRLLDHSTDYTGNTNYTYFQDETGKGDIQRFH